MILNMNMISEKFKNELLGVANYVETVCIMTAENPMGRAIMPEENNKLMNQLYQCLKDGNHVFRKVKGKFASNIENSVMICNISLDESKALAAKFSQESFIHAAKKCDSTLNKDYRGCRMMFSYYAVKNGYKSSKKQTIIDVHGVSHQENVIVPSAYQIQKSGDELDHSVDKREDDFTIYKNFRFIISFKIFAYYLQKMDEELAKKAKLIGESKFKEIVSSIIEDGRSGRWYFEHRSLLR